MEKIISSRQASVDNREKEVASKAAQSLKKVDQKNPAVAKKEQVERQILHNQREANRSMTAKILSAEERIVRGADQSKLTPPSPLAKKAGVPVARIHELYQTNEPKGFGTGFLVAPNLLITNQHVFKNSTEAENCVANFNFELNTITGKIDEGFRFLLRPERFFYNHEGLDFALVYVEELSLETAVSLQTLGTLPLIETKGKIIKGSLMNIIQYPGGGQKKYTTEDNAVFNIDDTEGIIYYYTDTQTGSSGSPVFNEFWEVAALHYTGVPNTNEHGQWLTKTGELYDKSRMPDSEVDWIGNAGKSVSKIIAHLKNQAFGVNMQPFVNLILGNSIDTVLENIPPQALPLKAAVWPKIPPVNDNITERGNSFNFYGNTNVYVNTTVPIHAPAPDVEPATVLPKESFAKQLIEAVEGKERFDEDYDNRTGYDPDFLEDFHIPVLKVQAPKELYARFGSTTPYIVPYHHYSLVMHKKRRMAMWTASNVNYSEKVRDKRDREDLGNGAWRLDARVPEKYQIQAGEFYDPATLVDKGHLVRRDDNCWAPRKGNQSDSIGIEYANADTFHWTNCTPQHEAFNRDIAQYKGIGKWGVLENEIKRQLEFPKKDTDNPGKDYGQLANVYCGPVFDNEDPEYMDIQYPLRFWKVFAINSVSEGKLVYGFMLSQQDKIDDTGLEKEAVPRWNKMVKALQCSLEDIENASGVIFPKILHQFDVKRGQEPNDPGDNLEGLKRK